MADWILVPMSMILLAACLMLVVALPLLRMFNERVARWCCRELAWHDGSRSILKFDGVNVHAECRFCGRPVMLDSHGNWFVVDVVPGVDEQSNC